MPEMEGELVPKERSESWLHLVFVFFALRGQIVTWKRLTHSIHAAESLTSFTFIA